MSLQVMRLLSYLPAQARSEVPGALCVDWSDETTCTPLPHVLEGEDELSQAWWRARVRELEARALLTLRRELLPTGPADQHMVVTLAGELEFVGNHADHKIRTNNAFQTVVVHKQPITATRGPVTARARAVAAKLLSCSLGGASVKTVAPVATQDLSHIEEGAFYAAFEPPPSEGLADGRFERIHLYHNIKSTLLAFSLVAQTELSFVAPGAAGTAPENGAAQHCSWSDPTIELTSRPAHERQRNALAQAHAAFNRATAAERAEGATPLRLDPRGQALNEDIDLQAWRQGRLDAHAEGVGDE